MSFKDHFSGQAADYARFRPRYPAAMFAYLAGASRHNRRAWDCGTGSGQAAVALSRHFSEVIATDASAEQIAHAEPAAGIAFRVAPAEASGLPDRWADIVTVAQALHWFDLDRFYAEARRVAAPGAIIAAWCYNLLSIAPALDAEINRFYGDVVGPYWPAERRLLEEGYATLPFPFERLPAPAFAMEAEWALDDLIGYFATWSATARYRQERGSDPLPELRRTLERYWGDAATPRPVRWPLALHVGRA
jgi:SAM-dependent methyltransferase